MMKLLKVLGAVLLDGIKFIGKGLLFFIIFIYVFSGFGFLMLLGFIYEGFMIGIYLILLSWAVLLVNHINNKYNESKL